MNRTAYHARHGIICLTLTLWACSSNPLTQPADQQGDATGSEDQTVWPDVAPADALPPPFDQGPTEWGSESFPLPDISFPDMPRWEFVPPTPGVHIVPGETDFVVIGQSMPLDAKLYDDQGMPIDNTAIVWTSSDPSLLQVDPTGMVTGITYGGGDSVGTDGTLYVTAAAGGSEVTLPLQVVRPIVGTGLEFVSIVLSDQPSSIEDAPTGQDHYDGVYLLDIASGATSDCELYTSDDRYWNAPTTCGWDRADARLMVGAQLYFQVKVRAQTDTYDIGWLEFPAVIDEEGHAQVPAVPRTPYVEWSSSSPAVAVVDGGVVSALAPGMTTISARVGPQTIHVRLVVYSQYGYFPFRDFETAAKPEDGYLALFSSSNGEAHLGTLDTVRAIDLHDYRNLDYRPSKYGPQGRRLVSFDSGTNEPFAGGGCGMVRGAGDTYWLLAPMQALLFDVRQMTQAGGLHRVAWHADNAPVAEQAKAMCQAAFYERDGQQFLIGFDISESNPGAVRVRVANVSGLAQDNVVALPIVSAPFNDGSRRLFAPRVWSAGSDKDYLLFVEQGEPNVLHFAPLKVEGGTVTLSAPSAELDIATAATPDDPNNVGEAPALAIAPFAGRDHAFVGNRYTISVIDLTSHSIVEYGSDPSDVLQRDLDIRWYGENIKAFALSPDMRTLFAVPEHEFEGTDEDGRYRGRTPIEYLSWEGSVGSYEVTNHRIALIDLSGGQRPSLMENPAVDNSHCYLESSACSDWADGLRFGIDLLHTSLKKWLLDAQLATSTGQLPPIDGLNIAALAASNRSIFVIGRDHPDGAGSALANLSDVAVYDRASGEGVVFRGWRANPSALQGLSDPFGLRLGEKDVVLGRDRAKNAGLAFVPGSAPPENAGDGPALQVDEPLPTSGNYANAPDPQTESGHLVLLSSSHRDAADGTHDMVRLLDLNTFEEQDFDPATAGKQGLPLRQGPSADGAPWRGGCGLTKGPGNSLWLFNGHSAVLFDLDSLSQGLNEHQITFDPDLQTTSTRVCAGVYYESGTTKVLYGLDQALQPTHPLWAADVSGLTSEDVTATAVDDAFVKPIAGVPAYPVRYVTGAIVHDELWLLEKNDPAHGDRNAVHRVRIAAGGALQFDATRMSDLLGDQTSDSPITHDPAFAVADFESTPHLFIGNENTITVYNLTSWDVPVRVNYNSDGDALQDDLDIFLFGRGIMAFAVSPDRSQLFALPFEKSEKQPPDQLLVPQYSGHYRAQNADRWRMVVLALTDRARIGRPWFDASVNRGNGIDLNYFFLKQYILDQWFSPGSLPPIFPHFRRQFVASQNSLFLIGFDNDDGAGSALANLTDLAIYDRASGRGTIWRQWSYNGLDDASRAFGFRLAQGDSQLQNSRVKNAGVFLLP